MISRRRIVTGAIGAVGLAALPRARLMAGQQSEPTGKIAFIEGGDIWQWSSKDGTGRLIEDGEAMDPTWGPDGHSLIYSRNGGSFSDLILLNSRTGNRRRLTQNEGTGENGSPDYVGTSVWSIDPYWSLAGIVCYVSDSGSENGEMRLWILNPETGEAYVASDDGQEQGPIEHVSVDGDAVYCVYTVFSPGGAEGGTTYVSMRNLDTGTTYPIIEGYQGAYAPAIAPDGEHIVASIRDENGVSDLWLLERESEALTRLTDGEEIVTSVWSPDSEWVAYLKRSGAQFELWALPMDTQGGGRSGDAKRLVSDRKIDSTCGITWAAE